MRHQLQSIADVALSAGEPPYVLAWDRLAYGDDQQLAAKYISSFAATSIAWFAALEPSVAIIMYRIAHLVRVRYYYDRITVRCYFAKLNSLHVLLVFRKLKRSGRSQGQWATQKM
jgi:hypothetical protein